MKHLLFILKAFTTICIALQCSCSVSSVAGNSSQTGNNGVTIVAMKQSICGTTHPNADISIYESNYLPYKIPSGFTISTKANDSGYFEFSNLPVNSYNLLVQIIDENKMALKNDIPVTIDSIFTDTIKTMQHAGFLTGIALNTSDEPVPLSYIYIKGSPFYAVSKNNGEFLLGPLPPGNQTVKLHVNFELDAKRNLVEAKAELNMPNTITIYPDSTTNYIGKFFQ
jgi:hypothetical protein